MGLSPKKKTPDNTKDLYYNMLHRIEVIEKALKIFDYSNQNNPAKDYVATLP